MALYESVTGQDIKNSANRISPYGRAFAPVSPYGLSGMIDTAPYDVEVSGPRLTKAQQFFDKYGNVNERIFVISSNVVMMEYKPMKNELVVEFKRYVRGVGKITGGGPQYFYLNITNEEWRSAKQAGSKGKWVWAVLRRGGKPYYRLR